MKTATPCPFGNCVSPSSCWIPGAGPGCHHPTARSQPEPAPAQRPAGRYLVNTGKRRCVAEWQPARSRWVGPGGAGPWTDEQLDEIGERVA